MATSLARREAVACCAAIRGIRSIAARDHSHSHRAESWDTLHFEALKAAAAGGSQADVVVVLMDAGIARARVVGCLGD